MKCFGQSSSCLRSFKICKKIFPVLLSTLRCQMLFLTNERAKKAEITAWAPCWVESKGYVRGSVVRGSHLGLTGTMSYVGICLNLWTNQAVC